MRIMHPNREGSFARRHAIEAYRRHGLSVQGHDRERPLDRSGVALDYHYEEGLVAAGAPRQMASDLVESLVRCQRSRWNAQRAGLATRTVALALLAVLLGSVSPALARGPQDGGAKPAECAPSPPRVICAEAGPLPATKGALPPGTYQPERTRQ